MSHDHPDDGTGDMVAQRYAMSEQLIMLNAFIAAADNRAAVMDLIGAASSVEDAAAGLMALLDVDADGAQVVLDSQLRRFTAQGRERLVLMRNELTELLTQLD